MNVEWFNIDKICPYAMNAKLHDKAQIKNVAESIRRFGWQQPLVIDSNNIIVIGHCRFEAAKLLRLKTVPCIRESFLSDVEIRELRIADNKTNESQWDYEILADETARLNFDGFDFDFCSLKEETEQQINGTIEYDTENFEDKKFKCCCPECGFRFNP